MQTGRGSTKEVMIPGVATFSRIKCTLQANKEIINENTACEHLKYLIFLHFLTAIF